MGIPLREGPQRLLDGDLLTKIFQCFTLVQPDSVDVFEGHLETSENIKDFGGRISNRDDDLGMELTRYASTRAHSLSHKTSCTR